MPDFLKTPFQQWEISTLALVVVVWLLGLLVQEKMKAHVASFNISAMLETLAVVLAIVGCVSSIPCNLLLLLRGFNWEMQLMHITTAVGVLAIIALPASYVVNSAQQMSLPYVLRKSLRFGAVLATVVLAIGFVRYFQFPVDSIDRLGPILLLGFFPALVFAFGLVITTCWLPLWAIWRFLDAVR